MTKTKSGLIALAFLIAVAGGFNAGATHHLFCSEQTISHSCESDGCGWGTESHKHDECAFDANAMGPLVKKHRSLSRNILRCAAVESFYIDSVHRSESKKVEQRTPAIMSLSNTEMLSSVFLLL